MGFLTYQSRAEKHKGHDTRCDDDGGHDDRHDLFGRVQIRDPGPNVLEGFFGAVEGGPALLVMPTALKFSKRRLDLNRSKVFFKNLPRSKSETHLGLLKRGAREGGARSGHPREIRTDVGPVGVIFSDRALGLCDEIERATVAALEPRIRTVEVRKVPVKRPSAKVYTPDDPVGKEVAKDPVPGPEIFPAGTDPGLNYTELVLVF